MENNFSRWREKAACADEDPELFFPGRQNLAVLAKEVCKRCEVRVACLEYALANNEQYGVWGGATELERSEIKRLRRYKR